MAIVCKDAAKKYIDTSPDFEIIGPVIMNSDIVLESTRHITSVGITSKKSYHRDFVRELYGKDVEIIELMPQSLPYVYETARVDAIITDITKFTSNIKGEVKSPSQEDYVTNVLIARSDFIGTKEYKDFVNKYNEIVNELNSEGLPIDYIEKKTNLDEGSYEYWKVKLLTIK